MNTFILRIIREGGLYETNYLLGPEYSLYSRDFFASKNCEDDFEDILATSFGCVRKDFKDICFLISSSANYPIYKTDMGAYIMNDKGETFYRIK